MAQASTFRVPPFAHEGTVLGPRATWDCAPLGANRLRAVFVCFVLFLLFVTLGSLFAKSGTAHPVPTRALYVHSHTHGQLKPA